MDDVFADLDVLVERFDCDGVEEKALAALRECAGEERKDLWAYVAWARFEVGRLRAALVAAEEADDDLIRAKAHFHLWEMAEAESCLERFQAETDEDLAEAEWYRGVLAEFSDRDPTAHFAKASMLLGDTFLEPVRLTDAEVDAVAREAMAALPDDARKAVEDTVVQVRPLPRPQPDLDPLTLGVYQGIDRLRRSVDDGPAMPPHIELFQKNIERIASDRSDAVEELRITLLHEIGHHLGMGEEDLENLGFG